MGKTGDGELNSIKKKIKKEEYLLD